MTELRGEVAVDVYHDCVRDAVRGSLSRETATELHRALALALESRAQPSWERLATHWHLAGDDQRAEGAALSAAEQASASFAFSKAADFYALARSCSSGSASGVAEKRAFALVYAGRCAEAAGEFQEAARSAGEESAAFTFRRLSAEMHLVSGQWTEGLSLLEPLFESLGITLTTRPWLAKATFLYLLGRVRSRNFDFERRAEHECDPVLLRKVDVCLAATNGLVAVDTRRGLTFLMRAAVYAVQAGEPRRVCHAWALYLCAESALDETPTSWVDGEWARLRDLASSCRSPELELAVDTMHAIGLSLVGRFETSSHYLERTDATLRGDGRAVTFHFGGRLGFITNSRYFAGDLSGFVRLCQRHRAESQAAGDSLSYSGARLFVTFDSLRRGEVDEARAVIQAAVEGWPGFHSMHAWAAFASISATLYEGDGPRAQRELDAFWPDLVRAGTMALRLWGAVFRMLRAMVCLCGLPLGTQRTAKAVRRMERQLSSSQDGWVQAFGSLVRARRLLREGNLEESMRVHDEAASAFERHSMALYAACTRRRQGELLGDAGFAMIQAADAFMRSHGIVDPERWTRMYAP
jgi:tetratricopeptide (TPR) repeat protein